MVNSPIKRENEDQLNSPNKRNNSNGTLSHSEPAFDLGMGGSPANSNNSNINVGQSPGFQADTPGTPFGNIGSIDNASLPNKSSPATNLLKEDTTGTPTSGVSLALPKKNDKKNKSSTNQQKGGNQPQQADASKMQDVLFSAGVNIREEEALLNSSVNASKSQSSQLANMRSPDHPPFLHPDQLAMFMKKISNEQNFPQNFSRSPDILNLVSSVCEAYMKDIITNALVISRHRRKAVKINSGRRSDVAIALKGMAQLQKKEEERRVKKRIALGLEKEDYENKIDSEETLHRASNMTAGLRAGSKKQYGWLTSSTSKPTNVGSKTSGKVASDIATRGDSGLRFREAREEPGIVMRDLLFALENRRMGTHNIISKGYARIRD